MYQGDETSVISARRLDAYHLGTGVSKGQEGGQKTVLNAKQHYRTNPPPPTDILFLLAEEGPA